MGIKILLPGGFKPPHMGHVQLAKAYAKNPDVDEVIVLVGPSEREGINRDQSIAALKMLLKDPKIKVESVEYDSPMTAAFETILNLPKDDTSTYALAASSKGGDFDRINSFAKSIEQYKTKPTKDGRTAPKGIKIDDSLKVDVAPLIYKGRTDGKDGEGISASTLRQDIRNGDKENFVTNYPGVDKNTTDKLFDAFSKTIKQPEEAKPKKKSLKESSLFGQLLEQRAINNSVLIRLLTEGGNAIPTSIAVDKKDIRDIVKQAIQDLPKELRAALQIDIGSSGYKAQSGDIDIFIDEDAVIDYFKSKDSKEAKKALESYLSDKGLESKTIGRNVHVGIPYKDAKAQVDFMIIKDSSEVAPWHQHGPRGSYEDPEFKGSDIFILLNSIGKSLGLKFDAFGAKLMRRDDNSVVARDRDKVAKILLNPKATANDLNSVKSILIALENDPKRDEKLAQAKEDEKKGIIKMTFNESLLNEAARIDHPEDLIYWEGSKGAEEALKALTNIDPKSVTVKWDGSPAVVFGYDENGKFIFTDKNAFAAKGYNGKTTSAAELEKMIVDRGSRSGKDYSDFGKSMGSIFDKFKAAIPKQKGFYAGDMLYFKKPEVENGNYVFTPNVVTYTIPTDSELGNKIGKSEAGVVVHSFTTLDGETEPISANQFNENAGILIVPPVTPKQAPKSDSKLSNEAKNQVNSAKSSIDKILNSSELQTQKLSDLSDILYTYTNNRVEDLSKINAKDFADFVSKSAKITETKKQKLGTYIKENQSDFDKLFNAVKAIANLKNDIISKLDSQPGTVSASIGDKSGGEGYVIDAGSDKIKLVNRGGFTAANRAIQR
jgi:hypothetical protein